MEVIKKNLDHFSPSILRPKMVLLDTDCILMVKAMYEFLIYCVLITVVLPYTYDTTVTRKQ